MAAQWISSGEPVPAVPLRLPRPRREWKIGCFEIARAARPAGRWSAQASPRTGAAGYRTPLGALLAAWRVARRHG